MSRPIAYVSSRFPVLREMFIIREVLALERAGIDVRVYSLKRPDRSVDYRRDGPAGREPYYSPFLLSWQLVVDNLATFARSPWLYISTPLSAAWRFRAHPLQALKCIALFPKMIHYGRRMKAEGVQGVNACWASLPALVALVAKRFFDLPYCMTCRAWDIFVPMNQRDLPVKIAAASAVRTNNDSGAEFMRRFCAGPEDESKIRRVYNPFDIAGVTQRSVLPDGAPVVTSGGSLVEQKGLGYLLDAVARLKEEGLDCVVKLVGEGADRPNLEQRAEALGIADRVEVLGSLPNHAFLDEMRASHAFVLPSVPAGNGCMDGIPNVLIESMAAGVPVISTEISGIPELVENEVTGLLVPPRDAASLANAMRRLLVDRRLQERFSAAGHERVESMFDMGHNTRQLIEIYRAAGILQETKEDPEP